MLACVHGSPVSGSTVHPVVAGRKMESPSPKAGLAVVTPRRMRCFIDRDPTSSFIVELLTTMPCTAPVVNAKSDSV